MKNHTYKLTGNILYGNYLGAPKQSCKRLDVPTEEQIYIHIDGMTVKRTVHTRIIWRNKGSEFEVSNYFIIHNGDRLELEKVDAAHERELGYNTANVICDEISVIDAKDTIHWLCENGYTDEYVNGFIVAIAEHLCPKN